MFSWSLAATPFVSRTPIPDSSAAQIGHPMDESLLSGVAMTPAEGFS
jgi:hypothetical protein